MNADQKKDYEIEKIKEENAKLKAAAARIELGKEATVGLNETIRKYVREQEKHDQAMDKLSVREYEDPFKR